MTYLPVADRSREWIHVGAVTPAVMLAVSSAVCTLNSASSMTVNKLTAADDSNNQSLTAQAGRMQNADMDLEAGAVGIKPELTATGEASVTRSVSEIIAGPPGSDNVQRPVGFE